MKKTIIIALSLLFCALAGRAETVEGQVKCGDRGLGEVLVTDGFSFVVTDGKGRYALDLHPRAEFVYILTPKGYVADFSSGVPQFYLPVAQGRSSYDFALQPMKGDPDRFAMMTLADTQLDTEADVRRLMSETLPDLQATLALYADSVQTAGILLGDISWDNYVRNADYKDFVRRLGIPVYPVIGNHDFDKYLEPAEGADFAHIYKKEFGPLYYAFQLGDVYYIVLNNLQYTGHKKSRATLEQADQMHWLELLLNCVLQQDKQVMVAMHAPLKPAPERPLIPGGEKLKQMLMNKFHAQILSGHFHRNTNTDIGADILEHNVGAVCGTWWNGDTGSDGTPNGYQVFEADGPDIRWYYKSVGHDRDYQFKFYPRGRVMDRPDAVVVKVWNWDEAWRVRWYEDGRFMGDMDRFYSYDPDYLAHLNGRRAVADYTPARTDRYFSAIPSPGAKVVRIEVEDRFGRVYTGEYPVQ